MKIMEKFIFLIVTVILLFFGRSLFAEHSDSSSDAPPAIHTAAE